MDLTVANPDLAASNINLTLPNILKNEGQAGSSENNHVELQIQPQHITRRSLSKESFKLFLVETSCRLYYVNIFGLNRLEKSALFSCLYL